MNRRLLKAARLGLAVPIAAAVLAGWAPSAAFAHAALLGSNPAPGARLAKSPPEITLRFTEALNGRLSTAALYNATTGRRLPAKVTALRKQQLVLRPAPRLGRGAYRIEWHSVAADDGHALEGSFSFGVRAAAVGGSRTAQASPLAGAGGLRVGVRALLYASLFLFAGATLLAAALDRGRAAPWLLPPAVTGRLTDGDRATLGRRYRSLVLDTGFLAAGLATASALLDAANAAGGLSASGIHDFLLGNSAGVARLAVPTFVLLALPAAAVIVRAGAFSAALALGAIAFAGHADSASPRAAAVISDWVHLLGGAIWLGGIVLIAATWAPVLRAGGSEVRLAIARHVLPRFGRVALPAFLVVASTGALNAYFELGRVSALWETTYGRILVIKVALVALIAAASYTHALRLRPRLLAANPHPDERLERRHWRLLRAEPLLGAGVAVAVAFLVAFPLPRVGAKAATVAVPRAACDPCPLQLPKRDELAVAEEGGSNIVAAWIRRRPDELEGEVRLIDIHGQPSSDPFEIEDANTVTVSCGLGCRRFTMPSRRPALHVAVIEQGREYSAALPTRWRPSQSRRARTLLERTQATMRAIRSVRETETVNSVPGIYATTRYRFDAPDRQAYRTSVVRVPRRSPVPEGETVVVDKTQWTRAPGSNWQRSEFGGGLPFRTRSWFTWTNYAQAVRLLNVHVEPGVAAVALMDPGTPAWWTLYIDLRTLRVTRSRLIAPGHFMTQRFYAFNRPVTIHAPRSTHP